MESFGRVHIILLAMILSTCQLTWSKTIIEIKFKTYTDSCKEDLITTKCDPKFTFCLDRPRHTATINPCYYAVAGESGHFQDTNFVDFSQMLNIKGIPNPWVISTARLMDSSLLLVFQVRDDDTFGSDDHLQTWGITLTETVHPSKMEAPWTSKSSTSTSHRITFDIRIYCDAGYYNPSCMNYCVATDNPSGHYTCDPNTGAKICLPGWTGPNCQEDFDECSLNYCAGSKCENLQADYFCHCPPHYSGKNCTIMENTCDSNPCKNSATCTNMPDFSYNCTCTDQWEGENCTITVNPCKAVPCQNGAECVPSDDHTNYTCVCVPPFTGILCDIMKPEETTVSSTKLSTPIVSTSTRKNTSSIENLPGETAESTNTKEAMNSVDEAGMQNWHGILIAIPVLAVLGLIIICLVIRHRRRQRKLSAESSSVVYNNNNKSAFENNLYNDVNDGPLEGNERPRQHPPLPSTPTEDDQFTPTKPLYTPNHGSDRGAEGGLHTEFEIDMDADGYVKPSYSEKNKVYTKTTDEPVRSELAEYNHYTDFNRLKGNPEKQDSVEDGHFYHDLDEIALAVKSMNKAANEKKVLPPPRACLKFRDDQDNSKDYVAPSTQQEPAYNDTPSNIPVGFGNYGNLPQPSSSDQVLDDSSVSANMTQGSLYSKPAKTRRVNRSEPGINPLSFEKVPHADVKQDTPRTIDPFVSGMSHVEDEIQEYGLPLASQSLDGDYSTPRGTHVDLPIPSHSETQECQYDTPPSSQHSIRSLVNSRNESPKFGESPTPAAAMPTLPIRGSSISSNSKGIEHLDNNIHDMEAKSHLPPALLPESIVDHPITNGGTDSDVDTYMLPISVSKGHSHGNNDEISNCKNGNIIIQKGSTPGINHSIVLDSYGSSKT